MEHLKLILTLFNIILGLFIFMILFYRNKMHSGIHYFGSMAIHTLIYNLLLTGALITKYIDINLPTETAFLRNPLYIQIPQAFFILFMGGMAYSQFFSRIFLKRQSMDNNAIRKIRFIGISIVLLIFMGIIALHNQIPFSHIFLESLGDFLFIAEIYFLLRIVIDGRMSKNRRDKTLQFSYSLMYLSRLPLIFLMFIVPETIRFFSAIAILFYFNLIPLLWILVFFRKANLLEKTDLAGSDTALVLMERNGITSREKEIIELILAGKSNRDISTILYISGHTVKNHIYSIYKKMNVISRYELISLLN